MSSKVHKFFWKGKRVREKVYKKRQKQVQIANKLKSAIGKFSSPNLKSLDPQHANTQDKVSCEKKNCDVPCSTTSAPNVTDNNEYLIEGRRVIHVRTLGEHMFCLHCKSILSLTDIQDEKPRGLASIFIVKCRSCEKMNQVFTDKFHKVSEHSYHFDSNTKVALGTVNGGLGSSHINKLLTTLDIREMNWSTYRSHEKEVCNGLEETAQEACIAAALEERKLTIEHNI